MTSKSLAVNLERLIQTRMERKDELGPRHISPYLVSVPGLSVSMRWRWRARAWPVSVGPAGFLAAGLLLGPTLHTLIPLMRTDCMSTMVGVRSTVLVLSVSVPMRETKTNK